MTASYPPKYEPLNAYLRSIRNAEKQRYAEDSADWLLGWGPEPRDEDYDLGYMALQAVRLHLDKLVRKET